MRIESDIATARARHDSGNGVPADRGQQIVEAACDLMDESGLEGLTIRAVLKRTGLSRRAFYERFVSKDDMVLAVFEHVVRKGVITYDERAKTLPDPMERLKLILASFVIGRGAMEGPESEANNRRGAALSREHLRLADSRPQELQAAIRPLIDLFARHLAEGMEAGLVRQSDPERLAALMYNLVSTTVHMELFSDEHAPDSRQRRNKLAAEIWEFCRRAIAA